LHGFPACRRAGIVDFLPAEGQTLPARNGEGRLAAAFEKCVWNLPL
jgi:hypothetical protein